MTFIDVKHIILCVYGVICLNNYTQLSELELHALICAGDAAAENEMVLRYSRLVRVCARPYFLAGGDSEDLMQEGMLGLLSAIREYDPSKETSFNTYAGLCIHNRLLSAIKSASRLKHAPLNEGVSLDEILSEENQSGSAFSNESLRRIPEEQVLARESKKDFILYYSQFLSALERDVLSHYLEGLTCAEIAQAMGRSMKSVDNAVQRIRNKLARHPNLGDAASS